jgi:3',5'-cyclic-AMP phosphodiesterase
MSDKASRRDFIKSTAIAIAAATAGGVLVPKQSRADQIVSAPVPPAASGQRVLRFSHPTDIHVQPELRGSEGMASAFQHMMSLKDPPQMILTGGDLPMDTAASDATRSAMLWKLFDGILKDNVPATIPIHHTIGNHDIWGRDMKACGATGNEPYFGKQWFLDNFHYEKTYYSFNQAGWHFIVLDSFDVVPHEKAYSSRIAAEQWEWFASDLAATPSTTPIVVVTHIPIISVAAFFSRKMAKSDDIIISRQNMHVDRKKFDTLFAKYPNVKLCLSGHLHLLDRVEYNGVTHICDGAVCGDKWVGPRQRTPEGYSIIDLYADGSFDHQYVTYGWKAEPATGADKDIDG